MAGHSHWAGIKHKKGKADKIRSKLFSKLSREIMVSAKLGLPDPTMNARLRAAILAAREANMPKDNIERAIKKSQGASEENYDAVTYEGFAPGGVAVMVEVLTDNKNRITSNLRSIFEKNGGSLAGPGSVAYQFEKLGLIQIKKEFSTEDQMLELVTELNTKDFETSKDYFEIYTEVKDLHLVQVELEKKFKELSFSGVVWKPKVLVSVNKEVFKSIINLIELIEDDDDVQKVYSNFEIDDQIITEIAS